MAQRYKPLQHRNLLYDPTRHIRLQDRRKLHNQEKNLQEGLLIPTAPFHSLHPHPLLPPDQPPPSRRGHPLPPRHLRRHLRHDPHRSRDQVPQCLPPGVPVLPGSRKLGVHATLRLPSAGNLVTDPLPTKGDRRMVRNLLLPVVPNNPLLRADRNARLLVVAHRLGRSRAAVRQRPPESP